MGGAGWGVGGLVCGAGVRGFIFTMNPFFFFFLGGGWWRGGARASDFFHKESKSKIRKKNGEGVKVGGGRGPGCGVDGWTV